jgi:tetratricopeptide (TPR) repeat protein
MRRLSAEHPFPGLRPFTDEDRDFFFGRTDQIYALYRLLELSRFIAIIGNSGSGKSSLVRAGLLPLLEDEADDDAGRPWRIATLTPGNAPLRRLADELTKLAGGDEPETVLHELRASSLGLSRVIAAAPELAATNVVILVDQFEELFRYRADDKTAFDAFRWRDETTSFVQMLLDATRDRSRKIYVLITMRSDFIGDCARFSGLPEAVSAAQFLVPALTRDQREAVIRDPLQPANASIEAELVNRLISDVGSEMDQLPVLQHSLLRMWEDARASGAEPVHITNANYLDVGQVSGAISQHADAVLADLPDREPVAERVFRALSERDRDGRATRRALDFAQLVAETGDAEYDVRAVVERFSADDCSFLILSPVGSLSAGTRVDVVHEALLRRWARISDEQTGWLAAEERDARVYRGLLALVEAGSEAEDGVVLPAALVEERSAWWSVLRPTPAWARRYGRGADGGYARVELLLERSRQQLETERRLAAEREERDRELAAERLTTAVRAARTTRIFLAVAAVLLLAAVGGLVYALLAKSQAETANRQLIDIVDADAQAQSLLSTTTRAQLDQTIAAYSTVIRVLPNDLTGYTKQGLAYYQEHRYTSAIADFGRAIKINPRDSTLYRLRGSSYYLLGQNPKTRSRDFAQALADYNTALRLYPEFALAYMDIGNVYSDENHVDQSFAMYAHAIAIDPRLATAYTARGALYDQLREYHEAIDSFEEAVKIDPGVAMTFCDIASTYRQLNDPTSALPYLERAFRLNSQDASTLNFCGIQDVGLARYDHAERDLVRAAALGDPNYAELGYAYLKLDKYPLAIRELTLALQEFPRDAALYNDRGFGYAQLGMLPKAIGDYTQAIRFDAKYELAYRNRAAAYESEQKHALALADDEAAARLALDAPAKP